MKLYIPMALSLSYCAVAWWGAQYFVVHVEPERLSRPQAVQDYAVVSGPFEIHDNIFDNDEIGASFRYTKTWTGDPRLATHRFGEQTTCERQMEAAMRAMDPHITYGLAPAPTGTLPDRVKAIELWNTAKHDCWRVP